MGKILKSERSKQCAVSSLLFLLLSMSSGGAFAQSSDAAVKKILKSCATELKGKDIYDRNLMGKVEESYQCSQTEGIGTQNTANIKSIIDGGNIAAVFTQINSTDKLRAAAAIWTTQKRFLGKDLTPDQAMNLVCDPDASIQPASNGSLVLKRGHYWCSQQEAELLLKGFEGFKTATQKHPINLKKDSLREEEIAEFNHKVDKINEYCAQAIKDSNPAAEKVKLPPSDVHSDFFAQVKHQQIETIKKDEFASVYKTAKGKQEVELEELYQESPLKALLNVDSFRENDFGDKPLPEGSSSCYMLKHISLAQVKKAEIDFLVQLKDAFNHARQKGEVMTPNAGDLRDYMRGDPALVGQILAQHPSYEMAKLLCDQSKIIAKKDQFQKTTNKYLTITAAVVGGAALFVPGGEGVGAVILEGVEATLTVSSVVSNANHIAKLSSQKDDLKAAMTLEGTDKIRETVAERRELSEQQKESLINIGISLSPFAATGGVKAVSKIYQISPKLVDALGEISLFKNIENASKEVKTIETEVNQAEKAEKAAEAAEIASKNAKTLHEADEAQSSKTEEIEKNNKKEKEVLAALLPRLDQQQQDQIALDLKTKYANDPEGARSYLEQKLAEVESKE